MKITITGHPGTFVEEGNVLITTMVQQKSPVLPKDLPNPGETATNYIIYISRKQWNIIKDAVEANPNDLLIVEGYPYFDKQMKALSIFAVRTTTKALETARREAQRTEE